MKRVRYRVNEDREDRALYAYDLFRHGLDTIEISKRLGVGFTEANALKLVAVGRSIMLGKPLPYRGVGE